MPKENIAFFGLGTMGTGMARRLLKAGYSLSVYNRNPAKAAPLAAEGATIARSPREAAASADVLIAMLSDDSASRAIWMGDQGLAAAPAGATIIECSTLTVAWVRELASLAESHHLNFLDAPVTGTKPHAANGELTFLVGGQSQTLESVRPILAHMSKEIVLLGPVGSGAALKLINNFVCGVQAASLAEAMALMNRCQLDPAKALPILLNGAPGSPLLKTLSTRQTTNDPTIYFQLRHMAKDLSYAVDEGSERDLNLAMAAAALGVFKQAIAANYGEQDLSAIISYLQNGPQKPH